MTLFEDEDCGFEDLGSPNLFTPVKKRVSSSGLKRNLLFHDEDSGLGMENEDVPNTSEDIKSVVNRLAVENDLVSDGSGQLCLPTVRGKHQDLNNISHDTMASVLQGDYDDIIGDYKVIDCRYPYEYNGGHVKGAENIYTHDGIVELLHRRNKDSTDGQRSVLVFHCEFSSERGPKLCRYLRSKDRELNSDNYPHLNYPEIYLLYGGYKEFYCNQKAFCEPQDYKPMLHGDHADDLRHFRSKSKSWTAGEKRRKRTQRLRV
ncbi:hypothetical protein KUTeg_011172 [Tegillarca granosa]|uniref:M-phase inducer phosphatase n=1 Tax=Tegillarca granosa TaxID=220873 RepID=A0ABQ9F5V6_TEGGR|nr:hypothetical protein KUTeg_011172 [Tegillarca granosa]